MEKLSFHQGESGFIPLSGTSPWGDSDGMREKFAYFQKETFSFRKPKQTLISGFGHVRAGILYLARWNGVCFF
jgi:hypothetical protein